MKPTHFRATEYYRIRPNIYALIGWPVWQQIFCMTTEGEIIDWEWVSDLDDLRNRHVMLDLRQAVIKDIKKYNWAFPLRYIKE